MPIVHAPPMLSGLGEELERRGMRPDAPGLVYGPLNDAPSDWSGVRGALLDCYRLSREAAEEVAPVVFLVSLPALRGHSGAEAGMLAGGLVSAARALAMEGRKTGLRANVLGYDEETDLPVVARWVAVLLELEGVSGDVVQLGVTHHGKVQP